MKTSPKIIVFLAAWPAIVWFNLSVQAQSIDPATGLPSTTTQSSRAAGIPPGPPGVDPKTGLPMGLSTGDLGHGYYSVDATLQAGTTSLEVQGLIAKGQYDDALRLLMDYHRQYQMNGPLTLLLADWIELGRRFPKAREALVEIRDQYVHEFSEGRGYSLLFSEISGINSQLDQDDSTHALFQSIRQKDKKLAEECYGTIAPLLIKRGEFDLCLSYVGDPAENFESIRKGYERQIANIDRMVEMRQTNAKRLAQMGFTNVLAHYVVDDFQSGRTMATNSFVNGARQLIEILVGAGRKTEAEEIQNQAVAFMDDPQLKAAVSDAERHIAERAGAGREK